MNAVWPDRSDPQDSWMCSTEMRYSACCTKISIINRYEA